MAFQNTHRTSSAVVWPTTGGRPSKSPTIDCMTSHGDNGMATHTPKEVLLRIGPIVGSWRRGDRLPLPRRTEGGNTASQECHADEETHECVSTHTRIQKKILTFFWEKPSQLRLSHRVRRMLHGQLSSGHCWSITATMAPSRSAGSAPVMEVWGAESNHLSEQFKGPSTELL